MMEDIQWMELLRPFTSLKAISHDVLGTSWT